MKPWPLWVGVLAALALFLPMQSWAAPSPFADWGAVVVAGDHKTGPEKTEVAVFDNGRRDITKALVSLGFQPGNIIQFSVRPELYPDTQPTKVGDPQTLIDGVNRLSARARKGCLFYLTSHGNTHGVIYGELLLSPSKLNEILNQSCAEKPTVAIISACYSGVFIPALSAPNRVVMSAARDDRTSFGCGQDDEYTFFDQCVLEVLPQSATFAILARNIQACVAKREGALGVDQASEPQLSIGRGISSLMERLRLEVQPPG